MLVVVHLPDSRPPEQAPPSPPQAVGGWPPLVVAAHGGAGATTIARLIGGLDGGTRDRCHPAWLCGRRVVIVGRATAAGSPRRGRPLSEPPSVLPVAALVAVLVADGPWPAPPAARYHARATAGRVTVIAVPYVAVWRFDPAAAPPAPLLSAAAQIRAALTTVPAPTFPTSV